MLAPGDGGREEEAAAPFSAAGVALEGGGVGFSLPSREQRAVDAVEVDVDGSSAPPVSPRPPLRGGLAVPASQLIISASCATAPGQLSRALAAVLRTLPGYALLPNAGGGDCGAHSIGAFVGADHAAVRAAVVSYVAHDATALQPVYDGDAAGGDLHAFVIASLAHWIDTAHAREHRYSQPTRAIYCDLMGQWETASSTAR